MALKLMYLTNDPKIAKIAQDVSGDRIFLDLETRGKAERQANMDTVISHNSIDDVKKLSAVLDRTELLVRVNSFYDGSREEINRVIDDGADIVMLPYFKTADEVKGFIDCVGKRARTCILVETPEAAEHLDEILDVPGIDEVHIGLNDLHLGYKMDFMFQLVADGTVERLCRKLRERGIFYGFGGVGRVHSEVMLPAEYIIGEHYRLGSGMVILSRAFCDASKLREDEIFDRFNVGVKEFREYEGVVENMSSDELAENHEKLVACVNSIVEAKKACKV